MDIYSMVFPPRSFVSDYFNISCGSHTCWACTWALQQSWDESRGRRRRHLPQQPQLLGLQLYDNFMALCSFGKEPASVSRCTAKPMSMSLHRDALGELRLSIRSDVYYWLLKSIDVIKIQFIYEWCKKNICEMFIWRTFIWLSFVQQLRWGGRR